MEEFYATLKIDFPKKSQSHTLNEDVDFNLLNYCLNFDLNKETKAKVIKYLEIKQNKNVCQVKYKPSKKTSKYGRVYAKFGLQNMPKIIRNAILCKECLDIDIVNAHPVLLLQICNRMGWKCLELQDYIENRHIWLNKINNCFNICRKDSKNLMLRLMYGGSLNNWMSENNIKQAPPMFLIKFANEMKKILNKHWDSRNLAVSIVLENDDIDIKKNPQSSALSITLQIEENRILNNIINFMKINDINVQILCFDGLMVKNHPKLNLTFLKELEDYIKQNTSWEVILEYKEMNERLFDRNSYIKDIKKKINEVEVEGNFLKTMNGFNDYENIKKYFEQFVCQINTPACFIKFSNNDYTIIKPKDFSHNFGAIKCYETEICKKGTKTTEIKFIKKWLNDVNKRYYEKMDFLPPPMNCPDNVFNLFNGILAENLNVAQPEGDTSIFYDHINLLAGENVECSTYLLNFFADMVQNIGKLPEVCILLKSVQGTGKNIFLDNFGKYILGQNFYLQTADIEKVCGRFNMNRNKIMIVLDELKGRDGFDYAEKIKSMITSPILTFEQKCLDPIDINNVGRYFILSNNETPIKIEHSDRRFVAFECSSKNKGNMSYFGKLVDAFKSKSLVKKFYLELMNVDLTNFNFYKNRPITEIYTEIKEMCRPKIELFMEHICSHLKADFHNQRIKPMDLYGLFTTWNKDCGFDKPQTITMFGRQIKKINGVEHQCINGVKFYLLNCDVIVSHLKGQTITSYYAFKK